MAGGGLGGSDGASGRSRDRYLFFLLESRFLARTSGQDSRRCANADGARFGNRAIAVGRLRDEEWVLCDGLLSVGAPCRRAWSRRMACAAADSAYFITPPRVSHHEVYFPPYI